MYPDYNVYNVHMCALVLGNAETKPKNKFYFYMHVE